MYARYSSPADLPQYSVYDLDVLVLSQRYPPMTISGSPSLSTSPEETEVITESRVDSEFFGSLTVSLIHSPPGRSEVPMIPRSVNSIVPGTPFL